MKTHYLDIKKQKAKFQKDFFLQNLQLDKKETKSPWTREDNPVIALIFDKEIQKSQELDLAQLRKGFEKLHVPSIECQISTNFQDEKTFSQIEKAANIADMAIFLCTEISESHEKAIRLAMSLGAVPIVPTNNFFEQFNPISEKGVCFMYEKLDKWLVFEAFVRAKTNFHFPYDWQHLVENCLK